MRMVTECSLKDVIYEKWGIDKTGERLGFRDNEELNDFLTNYRKKIFK